MPGINHPLPYTCYRCLRASKAHYGTSIPWRTVHNSSNLSPLNGEKIDETEAQITHKTLHKESKPPATSIQNDEPVQGAMSRRLAEATEDALYEGGRAGRKAVEEAGFSEELKKKLLDKIQSQNFRAENVTSFAEVEMQSKIGRGTRDIATAAGWTGVENADDTVLRMLDDARKPLNPGIRGPAKIPSPIVDLRLKRGPAQNAGQRLANARDKSSIYATSKDAHMTYKEREDMRKELKERFTPDARAMPNSIGGLAALANERIEDAIARGQFKNIPRGKAIVRDARADNPFIDTTEYIMNKMIQRQDIVPPWIEKQQELVKTANVFRARLRMDWKRQASRTIASRGGDLQEQMRAADRYAEAERVYNPRKKAVEQISIPTNATSDPVMINIIQEAPRSSEAPPVKIELETRLDSTETQGPQSNDVVSPIISPLTLFRIPAWEAAEMSYLTLAIKNLNSLTRSYNLMAPDLAKKPYFSLDRELKSCFADVAPQLSTAIKERAARPSKELIEKVGHHPGNILAKFGVSDTTSVYDSKKPLYGLKEFWADVFRDKKD